MRNHETRPKLPRWFREQLICERMVEIADNERIPVERARRMIEALERQCDTEEVSDGD